MHPIAAFNLVSILANLIALAFLTKIKIFKWDVKLVIAILVTLTTSYNVCLFVEWSGLSSAWETSEDIIGIMLLMWWVFLFYALLQNTAEQTLFESRERFRRLVDNIPGVVYSCKLEKNWILKYASDEIKKLTGYQVSEFTSKTGPGYVKIIHPDDCKMVWDTINNEVNLNLPYSIDYRIIRKDGSICWVNEKGQARKRKRKKETILLDGIIFDITKQKQAEQAIEAANQQLDAANQQLQANEEDLKRTNYLLDQRIEELTETKGLLESSIAQSPSGIVIADAPDVNIRLANTAALDILGADQDTLTGINVTKYSPVWDIYRPDGTSYPPEQLPLSRAVMQGEVTHNEELIIHNAQGKKYWVSTNAAPIRDADGNITSGIVVFHDITKRKQAEQAIEGANQQLDAANQQLRAANQQLVSNEQEILKSKQLYKAIFEGSISGLAVYDVVEKGADFIFKEFNSAAEEIEGTPRKDIIGRSVLEVFPGIKEFGLLDAFKKVYKTGKGEHFPVSIYKDERIAGWRNNYVFKLPSGEIVASYEDITECKKAEAALRENEEKYRILFESANDAIVMLDGQKIVDCNSKTVAIYGCDSKSDIIGHSPIDFSPPKQPDGSDSKEKALEYINAALSGTPQLLYWKYRQKDGTLVDVEISINKISIDKRTYLQALMRDVTAQKQIQKERENLLKTLAEKNDELESVLYAGSHDLKSPILNIQGFSGVLSQLCKHIEQLTDKKTLLEKDKEKLDLITKQEVPEALKYITAGSNKINTLINNLLKVSRISRAKAKPEALDMNELVGKIQALMAFKIQQKDVDFTIEQLPSCLADKALTDQIFTNLIDNALKYLDPNRKGKINISGRVEKDRCIYCVQDNGVGIESSHQKKIFELFHRLNPETDVEGEGVGLTIVTRTLQLQKGSIWLDSRPGKGSAFYVALPAQ